MSTMLIIWGCCVVSSLLGSWAGFCAYKAYTTVQGKWWATTASAVMLNLIMLFQTGLIMTRLL